VRNSTLVECSGADNVSRLKHRTEAADVIAAFVLGEKKVKKEEEIKEKNEKKRKKKIRKRLENKKERKQRI